MRRRFTVAERTTAAAEGDVVVLLIGMRINRFRAVHHWLPVLVSMRRMLRELGRRPGSGLLKHLLLTASPRTYYVVQYWESKEKLYAYAHAPGTVHHSAWTSLNRKEREGKARGHVGIWHETYVVPQGNYEAVYVDMPAFGLAAAHGRTPLEKRGRRAEDRFAYRPEKPATADVTERTAPSAVADGA
ncbi:DUF4188 domain-containing protein [Streptomyces sp. DH-12]|uniref:DUF4188 domain-containing protein n=1 Tax=Streptomyces sp. DH-12 TaxID=2072509 RepID=UPI000CCE45B3|nr:DUF4188 domain-containing protein [Streptomyces sp. DH-12]PNV32537.1 DUF4188 domain-containing protein [Streptomyces sp. DH-12]